MAKKKAAAATNQPVTEQIPSIQGGVSALASANAPIIFFDEVPVSGFYNGVAHITLEALRFQGIGSGMVSDRMVVAHLRMNLPALAALKQAIARAEDIARQAIAGEKAATTH